MTPFDRPYSTGRELMHIGEACENMHLSGDCVLTRSVAVYNRTVRDTWLAQTLFDTIEQTQDKVTQ